VTEHKNMNLEHYIITLQGYLFPDVTRYVTSQSFINLSQMNATTLQNSWVVYGEICLPSISALLLCEGFLWIHYSFENTVQKS